MALIKCPECQNSISDKAAKCPRCGLPAEYFGAQSADSNNNNYIDYKSIVTISALIDKDLIVKVGNGNKTKHKTV